MMSFETPNDTFCLSPGYRWNSWRGGTVAFDYRSPLGVTATQSNQPGVTTIHLPDLPRGLPQNSSLYFFCTKKEGAEIKSFAPFSLFNTPNMLLHDHPFTLANFIDYLLSLLQKYLFFEK